MSSCARAVSWSSTAASSPTAGERCAATAPRHGAGGRDTARAWGGRAGALVRPALRLLAAPVSGALLAAAFPALDLGPLALVALVPLLLVVETARPRRAAAFAAFFALVPATRPLGGWRLLVLPAAWAVLELLRAHHPLGGFPWGLLALSQHDAGLLLPLARVVGGVGLAAVIVAVNLAVAFWVRTLWAGAQEDGGPRWRRPEGSGEPQGGAPVR